jgi:hypothetical protein
MAQKQDGHSRETWKGTDLPRTGEHDGLSASLGEEVWLRADAGTRESRLEAVEAKRPLTSLVSFNATFPQKGQSHKRPSPDSLPDQGDAVIAVSIWPTNFGPTVETLVLLLEHPDAEGLRCYQTKGEDRADSTMQVYRCHRHGGR